MVRVQPKQIVDQVRIGLFIGPVKRECDTHRTVRPPFRRSGHVYASTIHGDRNVSQAKPHPDRLTNPHPPRLPKSHEECRASHRKIAQRSSPQAPTGGSGQLELGGKRIARLKSNVASLPVPAKRPRNIERTDGRLGLVHSTKLSNTTCRDLSRKRRVSTRYAHASKSRLNPSQQRDAVRLRVRVRRGGRIAVDRLVVLTEQIVRMNQEPILLVGIVHDKTGGQ